MTDVTQYVDGVRWLKRHCGVGKMWSNPPYFPFRSKKTWWANCQVYNYTFWIKDPNIALLFVLALPPANTLICKS